MLDLLQRPGNSPIHTLPVAEARLAVRKLHFMFRPARPEGVSQRDVQLARDAAEGGPLAARFYRPSAGGRPAAAAGALPVLVWFHGGGWTVGDLDSYDVLCAELSLLSGAAVLSVDYRLGPEHRFPAAVEDAAFAVRFVRQHAAELAIDPGRLAVGGDSAGGNLAVVSALLLRDAGEPPPRFQLLVYPSVDSKTRTASRTLYAEGLNMTRDTMRFFGAHYLRSKEDVLDWRVSPLLAESLRGLPPALVITAELDPLCDEGKAYAERLRAEGIAADYTCYPGVLHGFFPLGKAYDAAGDAVRQAGRALADALK